MKTCKITLAKINSSWIVYSIKCLDWEIVKPRLAENFDLISVLSKGDDKLVHSATYDLCVESDKSWESIDLGVGRNWEDLRNCEIIDRLFSRWIVMSSFISSFSTIGIALRSNRYHNASRECEENEKFVHFFLLLPEVI